MWLLVWLTTQNKVGFKKLILGSKLDANSRMLLTFVALFWTDNNQIFALYGKCCYLCRFLSKNFHWFDNFGCMHFYSHFTLKFEATILISVIKTWTREIMFLNLYNDWLYMHWLRLLQVVRYFHWKWLKMKNSKYWPKTRGNCAISIK